ncbi:MAG: Chromosome-partitioning protein Spo0J [bacterium ADurb.Bin429]|nr:MAG: Chromosome-partitioning protein Spo0J [bacterium ADurb.Bin429]
MAHPTTYDICMIPIERIRVVNPRERNRRKFQQIIGSIAGIGLKKPITVSPQPDGTYDLVCGQGRLEAFKQLGETTVPAIIREVSREDLLLMSLVENIARTRPTTLETIRHLAVLRDRGYSHADIGEKTGMSRNHISELLYLLDHGEERLLNAVERGAISLTAALVIARSADADVQVALAQAFEEKTLTGKEMQRARAIADARRAFGKGTESTNCRSSGVTSDSVVRAFRREQERQRQAIRKAELCEKRLLFVTKALRMLLADEHFITLLRAEGIETLPRVLVDQVKGDGHE